jgi:hypothetical protein
MFTYKFRLNSGKPLALSRAPQKSAVPDAHKGFGPDVLRKPPNEFLLRNAYQESNKL